MTPRGDPNKTAPAAVLHGLMFSKSCALAHKRVPCTRAAAQAGHAVLLETGTKVCRRGEGFHRLPPDQCRNPLAEEECRNGKV